MYAIPTLVTKWNNFSIISVISEIKILDMYMHASNNTRPDFCIMTFEYIYICIYPHLCIYATVVLTWTPRHWCLFWLHCNSIDAFFVQNDNWQRNTDVNMMHFSTKRRGVRSHAAGSRHSRGLLAEWTWRRFVYNYVHASTQPNQWLGFRCPMISVYLSIVELYICQQAVIYIYIQIMI